MVNKLERIERTLREIKPFLEEQYKVKRIGVFGSYLRGEQKATSDLDLLVEFIEPISLFDFLRLEDSLEQKLGIKVDLVMSDVLKPRIKDKIKEVSYV